MAHANITCIVFKLGLAMALPPSQVTCRFSPTEGQYLTLNWIMGNLNP